MKIGIIGISSFTLELAFRSSEAGYTVNINNPKGNSIIKDVTMKMGSNVQLCSLEQAANTDIVLLFIPKEDLKTIIETFPDMSGKLIVHTSTLIFDPLSLLSGIINAMTYKSTAALIPEAHVVKLFNPVNLAPKSSITNFNSSNEIFFIADHSESRNQAREFLKKINFIPIDLSGRIHLRNNSINSKLNTNPFTFNPFKNNLN